MADTSYRPSLAPPAPKLHDAGARIGVDHSRPTWLGQPRVSRPFFKHLSIAFVLVPAVLVAAVAIAQKPSDRAVAEQILAEVGTPDAAQSSVAAVAEAKKALERAASARAAGDVHHGEMLEGLAREWAEIGRDLGRA